MLLVPATVSWSLSQAASSSQTGASEVTHPLTHPTGILPDMSGLDLKV